MSKSKGNVINPMELIAEYGSDALRLGLIASRSPGQNQAFGVDRVISGRNFCNKLWNIARFIENKLGEGYQPGTPAPQSIADHWIVQELQSAKDTIDRTLADYRYAEASEAVYHAIWDSVADWYIEASKDQENPDFLAWVLDTSLKLAHPFAPFVTETIWQTLPWHDSLLIRESWPTILEFNEIAAAEFSQLQNIITEVRFVAISLPGNERYELRHFEDSIIEDNKDFIKRAARLKGVSLTDQPQGLRIALTNHDAWLDVPLKTLEEHRENIEMRLASTHQEIKLLEDRLGNENYISKAPLTLVDQTRAQLTEKQALAERLLHELEIVQ